MSNRETHSTPTDSRPWAFPCAAPTKKPSPHEEGEGKTNNRESRSTSPRRSASGSGRAWPITGLSRIAVATQRWRGVTSDGKSQDGAVGLCARMGQPTRLLRATQGQAPSSTSARRFLHSCLPKNRENHRRTHARTKLLENSFSTCILPPKAKLSRFFIEKSLTARMFFIARLEGEKPSDEQIRSRRAGIRQGHRLKTDTTSTLER